MTELEFRNKVTWFSFALSLLVIWVHSYNAELFLGYQAATGMVYVLEHRIGDWFGQIAVPGFFMISGYRFYRDFDWGKLRGNGSGVLRVCWSPISCGIFCITSAMSLPAVFLRWGMW